jgi:hypothetical protein
VKKGTWAKAERSGGTSQKSTEKEKMSFTTPTAKVTIGNPDRGAGPWM